MIGILWAVAYFIVFGLPMLLIPKTLRKTNKFMNRCELEKDLYKFISKHKDWSYVVIHFKDEEKTAKVVTVYSNQKRPVQLAGRYSVETYLNGVLRLDPDVKNAILDNYSNSYNLHDNGFKNLNGANARKIAKVLAMRFGGHVDVVEKLLGDGVGIGFYEKYDGGLGYDRGEVQDYPHFVIIYSKEKWSEKQKKLKQERYVREERAYKGY